MKKIFSYNYTKHLSKIFLGFTFLYYLNSLVDLSLDFTGFFEKNSVRNVLLALLFFLASFFLKFQRLAIIASMVEKDASNSSMRELFSIHTLSSSLALILPFKLGDIARVLLLKKYNYDYPSSLVIVLFERLLDLFVILLLVFFVGSIYKYLDGIDGLAINTRMIFLFFMLITTYVFIFTLKFWYGILIRNQFTSLSILGIFIENILYTLSLMGYFFQQNGVRLLLFTIVIWVFEALAFTTLYIYFDVEFSLMMFLAFISLIAFALPAGPVGYGAIHLVFYYALESNLLASDFVLDGIYYSIYIYVPALIIFSLFWFVSKNLKRDLHE